MCLLSVYSPGAMVNVEHLEAGAYNNPDGYGFAVIVGDRIETGHGMDAFAVIDAFDRVRFAHPESWAMFHSRFTTDGLTSVDNCHPFQVGGDARTILAHNGILPHAARPKGKDQRSDTRILAESLIPNRHFGRLHRPRGRRALEKWIGSEGYPNKVAILTVDPRYRENAFILGEHLGVWDSGVWHSNFDYVPYTFTPRASVAKMSDPFGAYMAGKISYSEYIDLKYGIVKQSPVCPVCDEAKDVDTAYMYCRKCKVCLDCLTSLEGCDCWIPHSKRDEVPYPGGTIHDDDGELSPVAVEAALANLPTEQAIRVRSVLGKMP